MDLTTFLIQCLNAVQYGLLLFLLASGLTLIFGIMGVINLAHGSFYMLGAYLAFSLAPLFGPQFLVMLICGIAQESDDVVLRGSPESGRFTVLRYCGDRLTAAETFNHPAEHMAIRRILAAGIADADAADGRPAEGRLTMAAAARSVPER